MRRKNVSDQIENLQAGNQPSVRSFLREHRGIILLVLIALPLYVAGIRHAPPGFFIDESSIAYNALTISQSGVDEYGVSWPLYFRAFGEYKNPTYIYLLAGLFKLFGPSILVARLFSATLGFMAAVLLGFLAGRMTRRRTVGIVIGLTALLTPWLFSISRLVYEVALYPLLLVLFLLVLYRAQTEEKWSPVESVVLAFCLALITYTYTIGRLLGPLIALGLVFFATRKRLVSVLQTWLAYSITLIPLLLFHLQNPGALTARFKEISYVTPQLNVFQTAVRFVKSYIQNVDLLKLLLDGDSGLRHHVPGIVGSLLVPTAAAAVIGADIVIRRHWRDPWWRFILYGVVVSVVPASLVDGAYSTLRLIPFPIFLLVLTVPALAWLCEKGTGQSYKRIGLSIFLFFTLAQGAAYQWRFHQGVPERGAFFDEEYPRVFSAAVAESGARPIYLDDRTVPRSAFSFGYIQAYWYGALRGMNASQFVHLDSGVRPPAGAVVISTEPQCSNCLVILKLEQYTVYRVLD